MTVSSAPITQRPAVQSYVRPESHQLFMIFTGGGQVDPRHVPPLEFIEKTGIGGRNIVIFRDPYLVEYRRGISEEHNSFDGIVEWQRRQLPGTFSHVREVFCVGTSSGGGAAIHVGQRLAARAVWSLAGRMAVPGLFEQRQNAAIDFFSRVLGRSLPGALTEAEAASVRAAWDDPSAARIRALTSDPDVVLDREEWTRLVRLVRDTTTDTRFHFYYATTNPIDRRAAEAFADCPRAVLHPAVPLPPPPGAMQPVAADVDHNIVRILDDLGALRTLFADYL